MAMTLPTMAQQVKYSVSGTSAKNGQKVYLIDRLSERPIDSVTVASDKFAFSGTAEKNALMAVEASGRRRSSTTARP